MYGPNGQLLGISGIEYAPKSQVKATKTVGFAGDKKVDAGLTLAEQLQRQ